MQTSSPNPAALGALIQQAQSASEQSQRRAESAMARALLGPRRRWHPAIGIAVGLMAVVVWVQALHPAGPTGGQVRHDLGRLLLQARQLVDSHVQQTGELPPALPDPTLALIVRYRIDNPEARPPRYALSAELAGVRLEWPSTREAP